MSASACAKCRNPVPAGSAFCPSCGFAQAASPAQPSTPTQPTQPAQPGQPAQPTSPTTPAGGAQPPAGSSPSPAGAPVVSTPVSGSSTPPAGPTGTPALTPVPPPGGISGKVAAALVAVVVVLAIFAIVKIGGEPEVETGNGGGEVETGNGGDGGGGTGNGGDGGGGETGNGGGTGRGGTVEDDLGAYIQRQVGPFRLAEVEPAREFATKAGAAGALAAGYTGPNRGVFHMLAAFESPREANRVLVVLAEDLLEDGYEFVNNGQVTVNDEQVGEWGLFKGETQVMLWTNGVLFAIAEGADTNAEDFYSNVPY